MGFGVKMTAMLVATGAKNFSKTGLRWPYSYNAFTTVPFCLEIDTVFAGGEKYKVLGNMKKPSSDRNVLKTCHLSMIIKAYTSSLDFN